MCSLKATSKVSVITIKGVLLGFRLAGTQANRQATGHDGTTQQDTARHGTTQKQEKDTTR